MASELASVEKLREGVLEFAPNIRRKVCMALDEIEREVEREWTKLPVDADGVPIRLGDRLWVINDYYPFYVHSIAVEKDKAFVKTNTNHVNIVTYKAEECHHVNLRTIEDVLFDYATNSLTLEEAADELRGMMEAGDD